MVVSNKTKSITKTEFATFGAGCFWHVEDAFRKLKGVINATSGYSGGKIPNPSYEDVCSGKTGHAEVVQVEYDPKKINYEELLDVFWSNHNPTQLNRQGPDVGYQYRSVIFYRSQKQKEIATKSKWQIQNNGKWKSPIATSIEPASIFYPAEEYHQRYLEKHGMSSCKI